MGDRKARLAALAAKAGRTKQKQGDEDESNISNETANDSSSQERKTISFRNYAPRDASMDIDKNSSNGDDDNQGEGDESAAKKRRLEETSSGTKTTSLAEALAEAQNDIVKGPGATEEGVNVMAPKKVNWDLKRGIESKLAKLERRTQRALVELLKERLDKEADEVDEEEPSELD
ncbi:unnamed protein product [Cylindrotheca closterium]|uniref:Coiled-coil domain-containing protein 12 n=1 Tax=Cylindrotheca closterium TaxID=2856 RepID=A0AAD2CB43_9STRA|nr:unnamed protein product [Cylindrotheca closterium]